MVLSEREIQELIGSNQLLFQPPLVDKQVGASAIDLRLGYNFAFYPTLTVGLTASVGAIFSQTVDLRDERLVGEFINQVRQYSNQRLEDGKHIDVPPGLSCWRKLWRASPCLMTSRRG